MRDKEGKKDSALESDSAAAGTDRTTTPASARTVTRRAAGPFDVGRRAVSWQKDVAEIAPLLGLGGVEVRCDEEARMVTEAKQARGVAIGRTIHLHPEKVHPGTTEGRQVLAHELVHLAQAELTGTQSADRLAAEREAAILAPRLAAGATVARPRVPIDLGSAAADTDVDPEYGKTLLTEAEAVEYQLLAGSVTDEQRGPLVLRLTRCVDRYLATLAAGEKLSPSLSGIAVVLTSQAARVAGGLKPVESLLYRLESLGLVVSSGPATPPAAPGKQQELDFTRAALAKVRSEVKAVTDSDPNGKASEVEAYKRAAERAAADLDLITDGVASLAAASPQQVVKALASDLRKVDELLDDVDRFVRLAKVKSAREFAVLFGAERRLAAVRGIDPPARSTGQLSGADQAVADIQGDFGKTAGDAKVDNVAEAINRIKPVVEEYFSGMSSGIDSVTRALELKKEHPKSLFSELLSKVVDAAMIYVTDGLWLEMETTLTAAKSLGPAAKSVGKAILKATKPKKLLSSKPKVEAGAKAEAILDVQRTWDAAIDAQRTQWEQSFASLQTELSAFDMSSLAEIEDTLEKANLHEIGYRNLMIGASVAWINQRASEANDVDPKTGQPTFVELNNECTQSVAAELAPGTLWVTTSLEANDPSRSVVVRQAFLAGVEPGIEQELRKLPNLTLAELPVNIVMHVRHEQANIGQTLALLVRPAPDGSRTVELNSISPLDRRMLAAYALKKSYSGLHWYDEDPDLKPVTEAQIQQAAEEIWDRAKGYVLASVQS